MVTVMAFIVAGFGHGLFDSALNGWISTLANSTRILSFTGAFYAVGAMLSPLIATIMITKAHIPWYSFFYVMVGDVAMVIVQGLQANSLARHVHHRARQPHMVILGRN